jgi:hypothetical protein
MGIFRPTGPVQSRCDRSDGDRGRLIWQVLTAGPGGASFGHRRAGFIAASKKQLPSHPFFQFCKFDTQNVRTADSED